MAVGKIERFIETVNYRMRWTAVGLLTLCIRVFSGTILGLVFALIFETIFHFATFAFSFVFLLVFMFFMRLSKNWGLVSLFVFDLVCVLIGLVLNMYLLIAPGA